MKKERCWSLGRTFQCIPESAKEIRWEKDSWEYKKGKEWKKAPIIGEHPDKYIYPTTFIVPIKKSTIMKMILIGIVLSLIGGGGIIYLNKEGQNIENFSLIISEWIIVILCLSFMMYIVIIMIYKIIQE